MTRRQIIPPVIALALLIAVTRLYTYHEPLEMDGATYAVIAPRTYLRTVLLSAA
jgi:hypothetical protein